MDVNLEDGLIVVSGEISSYQRSLLMTIQSTKWNGLHKRYEIQNTQLNRKQLSQIGIDISHLKEKEDEHETKVEEQFNTYKVLIKQKYPFLYDYQLDAVVKQIMNSSLLIADEMGMGKTLEAFAYAYYRLTNGEIQRVIIFCPKSINWQWQAEIKKWFKLDSIIIEGDSNRRLRLYSKKPQIIILNYELLLSDLEELAELTVNQLIIFDEMSMIKNPSAKRTKMVKILAPKYVIGATGTPVENRLTDVYTIGNIIHPGWMDRYEFYKYCRFDKVKVGKATFNTLVGYQHLDEFMRRFMQIAIRRKIDDVLEMPPKIVEDRIIPLSSEQLQLSERIQNQLKKLYNEGNLKTMLGEFVFLQMLEDSPLLLNMSQAITLKKMEIGEASDKSPKLQEIKNLLQESSDEKIVIFTRYKNMARLIGDFIEDKFIIGTGDSDKKQVITQFKTDPTIRVLIATGAFSYGVDLPEASMVINVDLLWNPAKMKQRIDRCRRATSKKRLLVVNLISDGIEKYMYDVMGGKEMLFNEVTKFNLREQLLKFIGR